MSITRIDSSYDSLIQSLIDAVQKDFVPGYQKNNALIEFTTSFKTCFAICAAQFLSKPLPTEIMRSKLEKKVCHNMADVRRFFSQKQLSDQEAIKKLQSGPITVTQETKEKERFSLDHKLVESVTGEVQHGFPLFENVVGVLQSDGKDKEMVYAFHFEAVFNAIIAMITANQQLSAKATQFAAQFGLPKDAMIEVVFPRILAIQAQNYLKKHGKFFLDQYPILEAFFAGGSVFLPCPYLVKFYEKRFFSYDANVIAENLVVSSTPETPKHVEQLFDNLVFNPVCEIRDFAVVADDTEFCDYFKFGEKAKQFGKYTVTITEKSPAEEKSCSSESRLLIQNKESGKEVFLVVYYFKTSDMDSLSFSHASDLKRLHALYHRRAHGKVPIMVQDFTGANKLGLVAVPLIFADEYKKIFSDDAYVVNINKRLAELRQRLPALVYTAKQYAEIIKSTILLNTYELSLSYSPKSPAATAGRQSPRLFLPFTQNQTRGQGQVSPSQAYQRSARAFALYRQGSSRSRVSASSPSHVEDPGLNTASPPSPATPALRGSE